MSLATDKKKKRLLKKASSIMSMARGGYRKTLDWYLKWMVTQYVRECEKAKAKSFNAFFFFFFPLFNSNDRSWIAQSLELEDHAWGSSDFPSVVSEIVSNFRASHIQQFYQWSGYRSRTPMCIFTEMVVGVRHEIKSYFPTKEK